MKCTRRIWLQNLPQLQASGLSVHVTPLSLSAGVSALHVGVTAAPLLALPHCIKCNRGFQAVPLSGLSNFPTRHADDMVIT